jgi:hypothetical protein
VTDVSPQHVPLGCRLSAAGPARCVLTGAARWKSGSTYVGGEYRLIAVSDASKILTECYVF